MRAVAPAFPSWGVDCITKFTASSAASLKAAGASFAVRYLGSLSPEELHAILDAGLLCSVVTYANHFAADDAVAVLRALGVPAGVTVWLDVEGVLTDPKARVNTWADTISAAGFTPGLYVGANCGMTAEELYQLRVTRYWRSMSLVPTPQCGFVMSQLYPTTTVAGVGVDIDVPQQDWQGRTTMMIGA